MTAPAPTFVKGLAGVVAAQTALSSVDGTKGILTYRGINIHDLAGNVEYEEAAFLLLFGSMPTATQLAKFKKDLAANRKLPKGILDLIKSTPKKAVPMDTLRTAISALAFYEKEVDDISVEATRRKGIRLVAQFPSVVAAIHRARKGKPVVSPKANLGHAENFFYMLHGIKPTKLDADSMNLYLVLLADHSLNASTFTARVASSTNADLHAAVTAALGALKGNLHGGAAEATMNTLLKIGTLDKVDGYVDNAFATKQKIMGIGHRIYKSGDPRAKHLLEQARKMEEAAGKKHNYVDMALGVENAVLRHRELYPNVDFFSAPLLYYLGIPTDLDTCVFAVSRIAGWSAHVVEQYIDDALIRPAAQYVGPTDQTFVAVAERK
jgi:citrate synthase